MAKTKQELLEEAKNLGIEVVEKAKVAEIRALINEKTSSEASDEVKEVVSDTAPEEKPTTEPADEPQVAKAGKRSARALKEEAERQAKEVRKTSGDTDTEKPMRQVKPTRSRLERRSKGYRKSAEQIEKDKKYSPDQAVDLAKKTSHVKFDATVELHVKLGVDPRQADQNIRDSLVLPAGNGKSVKIAVFTDDTAAQDVDADIVGADKIIALLDKGTTDFDILIATPNQMPKLGKYARLLGPRGLMPNPKSGTVTTDIKKAVAEAKAGRVEYRVDSTGIVHLGVGKVSFEKPQLLQNVQAVLDNVKSNKPQSLKGTYIQAVYLTTSMGPSVSIDTASIG